MNIITKAGIETIESTPLRDGRGEFMMDSLDMAKVISTDAFPISALPEGVRVDSRFAAGAEVGDSGELVLQGITVSFLEDQGGVRVSRRIGQDPRAVSVFITGEDLKSLALHGLVLSTEQTGGVRTTRRLQVSTTEQSSPHDAQLRPLLRRGVSPASSPMH